MTEEAMVDRVDRPLGVWSLAQRCYEVVDSHLICAEQLI